MGSKMQAVVVVWLFFVGVGLAKHSNMNGLEEPEYESSYQAGCTSKWMRTQKLKYGKDWDEQHEDHLFEHMKRCTQGENGDVCLVGPEEVYKAYLQNDIGFVFITPDFSQCIESYKVRNSSEITLLYKNTAGSKSVATIEKNGIQMELEEAKPFFSFISTRAKVSNSAIIRLSECHLDAQVHNYMLNAGGIFGLRKKVIQKGDIIAPPKTMGCTRGQLEESFLTKTQGFEEVDEYMLLANLGICEHHSKEYCVYGFNHVISAFERDQVMVVLVSRSLEIITMQYVNSVTGEFVYRHLNYFERLATDDIIIDGILHYYAGCMTLLDYMQGLGKNHTAIIRLTKCLRDFDDYAFNTRYDGKIIHEYI